MFVLCVATWNRVASHYKKGLSLKDPLATLREVVASISTNPVEIPPDAIVWKTKRASIKHLPIWFGGDLTTKSRVKHICCAVMDDVS